MAGNSRGADVAQLRALAQEFGKTSDTLLRQSAAPGPAINSPASWRGVGVAGLKSAWNSSHRALIRKTALALKRESKKLLKEANEQEKAGSARKNVGEGIADAVGDPATFVEGSAGSVEKAGKSVAKFLGFALKRQS
jgi:hypothetical protein